MVISVYDINECIHTLFNQRKVCSNQYISQKTVKNDKNRPNMLIQGPDGTLSNNSFFKHCNIRLLNAWVHTLTLFTQRKVRSNLNINPKIVKNCQKWWKLPKMLIQGLGGTLYAYFMVVKPPSSFSSQKMGMVGELVHSILWKVYFSEPD